MNFDDGENPWSTSETYIQTFRFRDGASASSNQISLTAILLPLTLLFIVQQ